MIFQVYAKSAHSCLDKQEAQIKNSLTNIPLGYFSCQSTLADFVSIWCKRYNFNKPELMLRGDVIFINLVLDNITFVIVFRSFEVIEI